MEYEINRKDSCQYRFTAYLMTALKHERMKYRDKIQNEQDNRILFDTLDEEFGSKLCYRQNYLHNFEAPKTIFDLDINNDILLQSLYALPELEAQILTLKFIENLHHHEIAVRVNLTKAAVDKRYQRILEKIRREAQNNGRL